MVNPKHRIFAAILITMCSLALLFGGVVAGSRHDGLGMGLCFFIGVYTAFCCMSFLLNTRIDDCFKRLGVRRVKPLTLRVSMLIVVVSSALIILSILAALRRHWLLMCVLLSAFSISLFIFHAVLIARRVFAGTRRLEELISGSNNGNRGMGIRGE